MTFWLDAHLNADLATWLGSRFKIVAKPLKEVGLRDADDDVIFDAARRIGNIVIVSKDDDFARLVRERGAPPQLLWLRCGNLTTIELQALLSKDFAAALAAIEAGAALTEIG